jgi:hypothetical protein
MMIAKQDTLLKQLHVKQKYSVMVKNNCNARRNKEKVIVSSGMHPGSVVPRIFGTIERRGRVTTNGNGVDGPHGRFLVLVCDQSTSGWCGNVWRANLVASDAFDSFLVVLGICDERICEAFDRIHPTVNGRSHRGVRFREPPRAPRELS